MNDTFYREDCDRSVVSLGLAAGTREIAGFRAQCHPLSDFDFEPLPGWLVVKCHECGEVVMRFRVEQYVTHTRFNCTCLGDRLVQVGYWDGKVILLCNNCHLPVLGAAVAGRSADPETEDEPFQPPRELAVVWTN